MTFNHQGLTSNPLRPGERGWETEPGRGWEVGTSGIGVEAGSQARPGPLENTSVAHSPGYGRSRRQPSGPEQSFSFGPA